MKTLVIVILLSISYSAIADMQLFKENCATCHASGVMKAPILGNKEQWKSRIKKGEAKLFENALGGFNNMPPKGGNYYLPEKDLKTIVRFMIKSAQ